MTNSIPIHAPELYAADGIAEGVTGFGAVGEAEISRYREQGFLVIHEAFPLEMLEAAGAGLRDLLMGRNPDFDGVEFEAAARERLPEMSAEERLDAVRKLMEFTPYDARLKAVAEYPPLMELLTRLFGEKPVRFQDMALLKPPRLGREKPWHQDHAYFDLPLGAPVAGVWIALDAATIANGCMHVQPGGHRAGPRLHFQRRDWQICDTERDGKSCLAVPLRPGGCLLFDGLLPHGTPHNHTEQRRRALQFHYKPESAGAVSREERLAIFGGEGRDVSC